MTTLLAEPPTDAQQAAAQSASPGSLRELLRVAVPLAISSGSASLMYVIDRVFLTWLATDAVAAALPASMLHWTVVSLAMGTVGYVNSFVAQYEGAADRQRVGAIVWQGIYLSLAASLAIMAMIPLAPWVFEWFGHEPHVRALETEFFGVMAMGAAPLLLSTTLACFYSGRGHTFVIMWVNIAGVAINIVLDYLLIFGEWGFPRLGMAGAATATVTAWTAMAVMYTVIILRSPQRHRYGLTRVQPLDRKLIARLLKFGLPSGVQLFVDVANFTLFVQLIGRLGSLQLAATNVAFNLNTMAFIPLLGMGTAVMTLTGQRIGEGRPRLAVRTTWLAFGLATTYIALFALVYLLLPHWILAPYKLRSNPEDFAVIEAHVVHLLRFVAVYSFFDAMCIIFSSATRGAGDTGFALVFSLLTGFLVMVLPTWWAMQLGHDSLSIPWFAVTACVIVLGIGFFWRFNQGRWMTMRVIDHTRSLEDTLR